MYEIKVVRNKRNKAFERIAKKHPQLNDADVAAKFIGNYFKQLDREHLVVICLDARRKALGWNLVAIGDLSRVGATCREIFKAAILSNAHSIVLAHNHPSGPSEPSEADLGFTENVCQAGKVLDIHVHDHLVFGDDGFTSIRRYAEKNAKREQTNPLIEFLKGIGIAELK